MWRGHLRDRLATLGLAVSAWFWVWAATPAPVPAPLEAERAVTLFKAKVEQVKRFLAQDPILLSKQDFPESPTGETYYYVWIKLRESSFDVQHSNSLISPFMGYLDFTYDEEDTQSCGDLIFFPQRGVGKRIQRDIYGYSTHGKAMAHAPNCFQRRRNPPVQHTRFTFAYQDGRWIFKDAIRPKDNRRDGRLLAALGRAEPPHHRVTDNQTWEALIQ